MKDWYLVAYDVRDDKRLRKVAKILEGFGTRLQYSLFHCYLTETELEKLRWELARIMDAEDSLLVIGLCRHCVNRLRKWNPDASWPDDRTGPLIL